MCISMFPTVKFLVCAFCSSTVMFASYYVFFCDYLRVISVVYLALHSMGLV